MTSYKVALFLFMLIWFGFESFHDIFISKFNCNDFKNYHMGEFQKAGYVTPGYV